MLVKVTRVHGIGEEGGTVPEYYGIALYKRKYYGQTEYRVRFKKEESYHNLAGRNWWVREDEIFPILAGDSLNKIPLREA